jgi:hypothetical protein
MNVLFSSPQVPMSVRKFPFGKSRKSYSRVKRAGNFVEFQAEKGQKFA